MEKAKYDAGTTVYRHNITQVQQHTLNRCNMKQVQYQVQEYTSIK